MTKVWDKTSIGYKFANESYYGGVLVRRISSTVNAPTMEQVTKLGNALQALHAGDVFTGGVIITKEKF
ncbi:MAG: hypothetical protein H9901_00320 [Candidatus Paralactobacillus gallistercoris]|uniref:Uncharacterized protein n=1 Tax=Candidatus Paralactobacillus gallistercoris TaxID=2838724 RepID=A0A948X044_9LACO|nr:hypothetical protein [Candidatus Paralactobacillus gallistercoris]